METTQFLPYNFDMNSLPLSPPLSNEDSPDTYMLPSPLMEVFKDECLPVAYVVDPNFCGSYQPQYEELYLEILEQPVEKFRFRYKSEMSGTHGCLNGQNSHKNRKQTFPTVQLKNARSLKTSVKIRCSLYQCSDLDLKPHCHRLVKRMGKEEITDPHDVTVGPDENFIATFPNMGIIHTGKKYTKVELVRKKQQLMREKIAVEEGFDRDLTPSEQAEIDREAESEISNGILQSICKPTYSIEIGNLKSAVTGELKIVRMDHVTSPAKGGREIFLLVERVLKRDIKVRFFQLDKDLNEIWEGYAKFNDTDVHHQYAIVLKTPEYKDQYIDRPVSVFVELVRLSDKARSEPREFSYTPNPIKLSGRKRPHMDYDSNDYDSSELGSSGSLLPDFQILSAGAQDIETLLNSAEFKAIFDEFHPDINQSVTTDSPNIVGSLANLRINAKQRRRVVQSHAGNEYRTMMESFNRLSAFIRTRPSMENLKRETLKFFDAENTTNVLHIAVSNGKLDVTKFFIRLVCNFLNCFHILNLKNEDGLTALHIAVLSNNAPMVCHLIRGCADVAIRDNEQNTALHLATNNFVSPLIMRELLTTPKVNDYIDYENDDGNTPLKLALDANNVEAFKMLVSKGANINKVHKSNGHTYLRDAIENSCIEILEYLLSLDNLEFDRPDFANITPEFILSKCSKEVHDLVTKYMTRNNIAQIDIKEEPLDDEFSEGETQEEAMDDIKFEVLSPEELTQKYKNFKHFTPHCLEQLSEDIDRTDSLKLLAEQLKLTHLLQAGIFTKSSPSKALLKNAVEVHNIKIKKIRDVLENLNLFKCVQMLDEMAKAM